MATVAEAQGPYVGKALTAREFVVDDALLAAFHRGLDLPPEAGAVPCTVASDVDNAYFEEIAFPDTFGHLWMRQEYEFFMPLMAGARYVASGRIREIYERRNRNVVRYEVDIKDEAKRLVMRSQHHQSFLAHREPSGKLELRAAGDKPGARRFEVPPGEPFGGLTRTISLEMCGEFFHGDANYHTNRKASEALGFEDVVVGGRMTMALAAHVCEEAFGPAWNTSGRLDVKFTNPVWPGDAVTVRGVMTDAKEEAGSRLAAFVWLAKADGTVALVAQASADA